MTGQKRALPLVLFILMILLIGNFARLSFGISTATGNVQSSLSITQSQRVTLPNSWLAVSAIHKQGNIAVVAGRNNLGSAVLGVYNFSSGTFSDASILLPSSYQNIESVAYGNGIFLVGGHGQPGGILGSYNPVTNSFHDLTSLTNGVFVYSLHGVAWDGKEFLVGGAGYYTPLGFYHPDTGTYASLTSNVPYYFASNHIVWDGSHFLMDGAKAGPGGEPGTPPALGFMTSGGTFMDLSGSVPAGLGVMWASGYDGSSFLVQGYSTVTAAQLMETFSPATASFTNLTSVFPSGLNVNTIENGNKYFLIGGGLSAQAYFSVYNSTTSSLSDLSSQLSTGIQSISAIDNEQGLILVGGEDTSSHAYLGLLTTSAPIVTHPFELLTAATPTQPKISNNYFGPWIVVAMVLDSLGRPIPGLQVDFNQIPNAGIPTENVNTITDSLGVANETLIPNQNLVTAFMIRASVVGSSLSGETVVPLGTAINPSPTSLVPGASSASGTPSVITESVAQLDGNGNPFYQDLTRSCNYPFTSSTIVTNCTSGASPSSSINANVFCNDFKTAENIAGVISCIGFAAIVVGAFTGVIGGGASCPVTAGGGCAVAVASADVLFAVGRILEGTCLDFLLGAVAAGSLHTSPPPINVEPKPLSFVVSFTEYAIGVACDLATIGTVSTSGNTVSTIDGTAQLVFPAHTISAGTIPIVITEIPPDQVADPIPTSNSIVGSVVNVQFYNGQPVGGGITLSLKYDPSLLQTGQTAFIFQDGNWNTLPTSLKDGRANASVTSSGDYAVLSAPAQLSPAAPLLGLPLMLILTAVVLLIILVAVGAILLHRRKVKQRPTV